MFLSFGGNCKTQAYSKYNCHYVNVYMRLQIKLIVFKLASYHMKHSYKSCFNLAENFTATVYLFKTAYAIVSQL